MNLREIFKNDVSSSAFYGALIKGKFGVIEIVDGVFDVYFVGTKEPISERKLTAIIKKLPENVDFHRLTGEGWFKTTDEELVRKTLSLLGVKKRRQYSEAALVELRERGRKLADEYK